MGRTIPGMLNGGTSLLSPSALPSSGQTRLLIVDSLGGISYKTIGTDGDSVCAGNDSRFDSMASDIIEIFSELDLKAALASPTFTGVPSVPTATPGTNTTQIASTAFVTAAVSAAVTGLLESQGGINCSANPNYPSALKGDVYFVTNAGKIGGASGLTVEVGDAIVCGADNAGGTQAAVGTSWYILEHNLVGAVIASNNLSDLTDAAAARANLGLIIGTDVQAYNAALAAIAGLTPSNDDFLQRKAGTWANRTPAQVVADLCALAHTFTVAGAVSAPAVLLTGAPYTGGTGTTTHPLFYINSGNAPSTWNTAGTLIGLNAPSAYTGNFLDCHLNGGASLARIDYQGQMTLSSNLSCFSAFLTSTGNVVWSTRSRMASSADGKITLLNAAATDFTALLFGGTTSSFPSLKRSSTSLIVRLADDSADAPLTASNLTVTGSTVPANGMYLPDTNTLGFGANTTDTGVRLESTGAFWGYTPKINLQTGTTYTLQQSDSGKIVEFNNGSAITVTLPNNLTNFCCRIQQCGAGQITLSPQSGATLRNRSSFTKTAGQWAALDLYVRSNSGGAAAEYSMTGDGAT